MGKIKEKAPVQKGLKEKVKGAPKEIVRRGLDDGTQRLRGQLRDTAQRGQRDEFGGDKIEDAAWTGGRWAERGIEKLLKKKKDSKGRGRDVEVPTYSESPLPEPLRESPVQPAPPGQQTTAGSGKGVQIKTREDVAPSAPSDSPVPSVPSTRVRDHASQIQRATTVSTDHPAPTGNSGRVQIKTKDAISPTVRSDTPIPSAPQIKGCDYSSQLHPQGTATIPVQCRSAPTGGSDRVPIKTKEAVVEHRTIRMREGVTQAQAKAIHSAKEVLPTRQMSKSTSAQSPPSSKVTVKTKDTYTHRQVPAPVEQSPQVFNRGREKFQKEQRQKSVEKCIRGQQSTIESPSVLPQTKVETQTAQSSTPWQRTTQEKNTSGTTISKGKDSDVRKSTLGGKTGIKSVNPGKKMAERTTGQSVKTAEHTSKQTAKTAERSAKAVVKNLWTNPLARRRAVQAIRATKKAAKGAAKAGTAAIRAIVRAMRELVAVLAAGGSVVIAVVLVICLVGLLVVSPFGIFFANGNGDPNAVSPSAAVSQINSELSDQLSALQAGGVYDSVETLGHTPAWVEVFAVFAAKTAGAADGVPVAVLDTANVEQLRAVFWDMTKITTTISEIDHPATDDAEAWTERILTITITPRTPDDMRVLYSFTDQQNAMLDELLAAETLDMWNSLLYGSSGEIVAVALSQVGNVGGQPYWSWYGYNSRVEWCACFVSWCANECGYIDAGIVPKFASCTAGSNWFKGRDLWQERDYEPHPGDLIFFDWDCKGSSGPQDDSPDHVGIVERVENGIIYTVEGNSSDSCRQRSYSIGHYEIYGFGTALYN